MLSAGYPCLQPFAEGFFVGTRRFSAALLCVTQGKTLQFRRKRLGEGAVVSYKDAAKATRFEFSYSRAAGKPRFFHEDAA